MADNKYAKALLDYVQMPMAQLGAVFGTTPQKMSKALRQEGSNIYDSMKSAVTAPGRALQGQMNPQIMMDENGNIIQDDSKMNQEGMNFALNFMGGGSAPAIGKPTVAGELGIHAYHGSPHVFDKFDLSKIGTGEGAQAYGHGLYFAESPKVAETYKMPSRGVEATAATHLNMYKTPEKAISALQDQLTSNITQIGKKHTQDAIDLIKSGKATTGNMYKVDIADEIMPKMLDWNKPLIEQHSEVQNALAKIEPDFYHPNSMDYDPSELGQSIYTRLSDIADSKLRKEWVSKRDELLKKGVINNPELDAYLKTNPNPIQEGSNLLNQYGIKGIKYLDQGSRDIGQGTSNYVVFDPNTVKILERK
jgi:hypothetical protein